MTNQTTMYLTNLLRLIGNEHKQIRRVDYEFTDQLNNFSTVDEDFPILFISPVSRTDTSTWRRSLTFRLSCYDLMTRGRDNVEYLISDTSEILNDFLMYFSDENDATTIEIVNSPTIRPINNALMDKAIGSEVEIEFDTSTVTYCDIPWVNGQPTITDTSIVTTGGSLTCSDLPTCQTIIDIENDITNLDNSTYSGVKKVNTSQSTYFLTLDDANKFIQVNTISGTESVAVNWNALTPFVVGTKIELQFVGSASGLDVVFLNGSGSANNQTVLSNPAPVNNTVSFTGVNSVITLVMTDINEWAVFGDFN